jgi:hypothetical protein
VPSPIYLGLLCRAVERKDSLGSLSTVKTARSIIVPEAVTMGNSQRSRVRLNRLGHAEAQTTMGYTHVVTSDERKTAEELGKILHVNARNDESEVLAAKPLTLRIQ